MAGQQLQTTTPGMRNAVQIFDETISRLRTRQRSVGSQVESLAGGFRGTAGENYRQAMAEWHSNMSKIIQKLEYMKEVMTGAENIYRNTESDNTSTAKNLTSGFAGV